jgi:hypothetical protein
VLYFNLSHLSPNTLSLQQAKQRLCPVGTLAAPRSPEVALQRQSLIALVERALLEEFDLRENELDSDYPNFITKFTEHLGSLISSYLDELNWAKDPIKKSELTEYQSNYENARLSHSELSLLRSGLAFYPIEADFKEGLKQGLKVICGLLHIFVKSYDELPEEEKDIVAFQNSFNLADWKPIIAFWSTIPANSANAMEQNANLNILDSKYSNYSQYFTLLRTANAYSLQLAPALLSMATVPNKQSARCPAFQAKVNGQAFTYTVLEVILSRFKHESRK